MQINFSGLDAIGVDWVRVYTQEGDTIHCDFGKYLDGTSQENGQNCTVYHDPNKQMFGSNN